MSYNGMATRIVKQQFDHTSNSKMGKVALKNANVYF